MWGTGKCRGFKANKEKKPTKRLYYNEKERLLHRVLHVRGYAGMCDASMSYLNV